MSFFKLSKKFVIEALNELNEIHDSSNQDTTDKLNNLKANSKVQKNIEKIRNSEFNNRYQ